MKLKDTLNMPKTEFNMKASLSIKEPVLQQKWIEDNVYKKVLEKNKDRELFILHDGPPYANGNIHIGHTLNKILKDIIVRSKNMNGYLAPMVFGWDTHGLPIENALLKENKNIYRESVNEFRDGCKEYAITQMQNQKEQFFKLGLLADHEIEYLTLTKEYEASQIDVFAAMFRKGLIFKGQKPVYWSWSSKTALAEAEIEYIDKRSPAIYVAMDLIDDVRFNDVEIVIWTTTPWTIPGNKGVAVGEDYYYSIVSTNGRKFLVATDLVEDFCKNCEIEDYEIVNNYRGSELEGINIKHPFLDQVNQIMIGHHVTVDSGTGCVHIAPAHGEDDFLIGKKYNLDINSVVDGDGNLTEYGYQFNGMFYEDANKEIGLLLEEKGKLLKLSFIKHSYPHDWRTKKPVFFRTTKQWFADINPIKEELLKEVNNVDYANDWGRTRLYNMIDNRQEWCISRQRKWGVPIPIFYGEDDEPIMDANLIDHVASLFLEHGSNIWFEKEAKDLLPADYTNPASPNGIFRKETDIMDVWFDSGSSHTAVVKRFFDRDYADLYIEGSDQYRGWFNSSLITGVAKNDKSPFKSLVSHGFVLDKKGNKMSKSLGNVVDPIKVCNQKGADILRLWVANVDYSSDVLFGDEIINQVSEGYRKYRNTIKFLLGNLSDFNETMIIDINDLEDVDKYILIKLNNLRAEIVNNYEKYEFKKIMDHLMGYIATDLSSFYMDFIKDIIYVTKEDDVRRRQIQTVLYYNLDFLIKLMVPILPHTTHEAYLMFKDQEVILEDFPTEIKVMDDSIEKLYEDFLNIRNDINKVIEVKRNEKLIGKSLHARVLINPTKEARDVLEKIKDLDLLCIVSKFEIVDNIEGGIDTNSGTILVEKYDNIECDRCRKYFLKEEVQQIQLEEEHTVCSSCLEVINSFKGE